MEIVVHIVSLFFLVLTIPAILILKNKKRFDADKSAAKPLIKNGILIIPVKNEESVIPITMPTVLNNLTLLKILYVDDSSKDSTEKIILHHIKQNPNASLLKKENDTNLNFAPRQKVINFAINNSTEPIIAITDADCSPCKNWDGLMLSKISEKNVSMCYGYTKIDFSKCKKWGYIEWTELFFLFACSFGLKFLKLPSSCMGNNLVIKREFLEKFGGYGNIPYAYNDDQIIMRNFRKKFGDSSVLPVFDAVMDTLPINNFTQAINQKLRWIIDGMRVSPFFVVPLGLTFVCSISLIFFASPITKIILFLSIFIFTFFWSKALNEQRAVLRSALIYVCLYALPFVYFVLAINSLRTGITWKNAKVRFKNGN